MGSLKINVDGWKLDGLSDRAVAGVVRDSRGTLVHGFASDVNAGSVRAVETLTLLGSPRYLEEASDQQVLQAREVVLES